MRVDPMKPLAPHSNRTSCASDMVSDVGEPTATSVQRYEILSTSPVTSQSTPNTHIPPPDNSHTEKTISPDSLAGHFCKVSFELASHNNSCIRRRERARGDAKVGWRRRIPEHREAIPGVRVVHVSA